MVDSSACETGNGCKFWLYFLVVLAEWGGNARKCFKRLTGAALGSLLYVPLHAPSQLLRLSEHHSVWVPVSQYMPSLLTMFWTGAGTRAGLAVGIFVGGAAVVVAVGGACQSGSLLYVPLHAPSQLLRLSEHHSIWLLVSQYMPSLFTIF